MKFSRCFLVLALLYSNDIWGQEKKIYSGAYSWRGFEGKADFEFYSFDKDSVVLDGDFKFQSKKLPQKDELLKVLVEGAYDRNKKAQKWNYLTEDYKVTIRDVKDLELVADLSGTLIELKANYEEGVPSGNWVYEEYSVDGPRKVRRAFSDQLLFKKGDLSEKLEIQFRNNGRAEFIRGKLLENGVMDGEWVIVYKEGDKLISEVRNYLNGFLIGMVKRDLKTDQLIMDKVYFETIDKLNLLDQGKNTGFRVADRVFNLDYRDGFLSDSEEAISQNAGNQFIKEFLSKLLKFESSYVNAAGQLIDYPMHTRRMVYEFNRTQQRLIETIPGSYKSLISKIETYLGDDSFVLNKNSSESMAYAYQIHSDLENRLKGLEELVKLLETKDIQYHDVSLLEKSLENKFQKEIPINFTYGGESVSRSLSFSKEEFSKGFFRGLDSWLTQISELIDQQQDLVDESLFVIRQDSELLDLEKQIAQKSEATRNLYQEDFANEYIKAVYEQLYTQTLQKLTGDFAKEQEFDKKKAIGQNILDLLSILISNYPELLELDSYSQQVDELYQEEVFNPFTYSRYNQRIKPKLYDAYERLLEYYQTQLMQERNSKQLSVWIQKIQTLSSKMVSLVDQDTKSIERSINKRATISKLEQLLGLQ